MNNKFCILVLNLPGLVLKSGSRWYNIVKKEKASLRYYPYPWFMGYLTSLLKKNGFRAHLTDAVALEWSEDETKKFIKKFKPTHIVCEPTWTSAGTDAEFLNSLDKNIIKIAVGNYGSLFPEKCLKTGVDYVVIGEYEFSILDFLKNGKLARNFFSRKKKKYAPPDLVTNLDLFPFPERDDTPVRYYNEPSCFGRNLVIVSSRGCRFHCSFCNVWGVYGRQNYRTRSAKNVVDEIEDLQKKYDFDEIYFDDDNMVARKEHIDGICQEIIKRGVKVHFCCMGDARVDDETLELLAQAGCTTYKFGFEHTDREVLKAIPKDIDPDRSIEILRKCHRLGMKSYANLIVGLPKSTWKKDLAMFEQVFAARPDLMQIGIATPYPGTEFYTKATKMGWLKAKDITKFDVTGESAVSYPNYSADKITEMFRLGWKMWYKHVILHQPKTLWFFFASEVKRNGLTKTVGKAFSYLLKTIRRTSMSKKKLYRRHSITNAVEYLAGYIYLLRDFYFSIKLFSVKKLLFKKKREQIGTFNSLKEEFSQKYKKLSVYSLSRYISEDYKIGLKGMEKVLLPVPDFNFLYNTTLRYIMFFTRGGKTLKDELSFLEEEKSETDLKYLLEEDIVGDPLLMSSKYSTSHNSIHHLCHLLYYIKRTNCNLKKIDTIVEWGGGYGNLAKIFLRLLNRKTTYIIFDVPLMSCLQWLYLSTILGRDNVNLITSPNMSICKNKINLIPVVFRDSYKKIKADLFISTWVLSESGIGSQDFVINNGWFKTKHMLLGYAKNSLAIPDSERIVPFVRKYGARVEPIKFLPGNFYGFL